MFVHKGTKAFSNKTHNTLFMLFTAENILLVGSILLFVSIIVGKTGYRFRNLPPCYFLLVVGMLFGARRTRLQFHKRQRSAVGRSVALSIYVVFSGGMDTSSPKSSLSLLPGIVLSTFGVDGAVYRTVYMVAVRV